MVFGEPSVTSEQRALLKNNTFSLRPLSSAGMLHAWGALQQAILPSVVFLFALLMLSSGVRVGNEWLVQLLYVVGLFLLLVSPVVAFCLLASGVVAKKLSSVVRWSAVVFWSWWPFWKCALCLFAAYNGTVLGNFLYYEQFLPYRTLNRLQSYSNVDPSTVQGVRLQDAGVVLFNTTAGVDRSRTGCLKNAGTYCIAPIVIGNQLSDSPTDGRHDLFMAGMDCCTCPGEFRCGAWQMPSELLGGLRVLEQNDVEFFKLASQNWAATYGKPVQRPIFFTWSADPVSTWKELRARGLRILTLATFCVPFAFFALVTILNFILGQLTSNGMAAPLDPPLPAGETGRRMARRLLPQMSKYEEDQQAQLGGTGF